MGTYNTLLLAVDLSDESEGVAARASALREANGATLHLIHVIEPLSFAYGGDIPMDFSGIQEEIHQQAKLQLQKFGEQFSIDASQQHIVLGRPEIEIHSLAEELGADLIVVGSHGRHGLALLMGSTANGVLHGASCDVLAVRVGS
jgi:universal stress protein A